MKIDVKIKKMERVPWESIQDLQPMDFKNDYHSEKIKQSILKHNYASPIHVWDDNGQLYAVDGHLRMDLLKELKGEGADIPDKLPVVFLDLPDRETAVKYLLEVFNTKSNPINQDSLNQWMEELDVTLEELDVSLDDLHVEIENNIDDYEDDDLAKDSESAMPKKPKIEIELETVNDLDQLKDEIEKIAAEMYLDIKISVDYE
jgi:hypothetical protein